jgi:hypothetical protein
VHKSRLTRRVNRWNAFQKLELKRIKGLFAVEFKATYYVSGRRDLLQSIVLLLSKSIVGEVKHTVITPIQTQGYEKSLHRLDWREGERRRQGSQLLLLLAHSREVTEFLR